MVIHFDFITFGIENRHCTTYQSVFLNLFRNNFQNVDAFTHFHFGWILKRMFYWIDYSFEWISRNNWYNIEWNNFRGEMTVMLIKSNIPPPPSLYLCVCVCHSKSKAKISWLEIRNSIWSSNLRNSQLYGNRKHKYFSFFLSSSG